MFTRVSVCDVNKDGEWIRVGTKYVEKQAGPLLDYILNELREFIEDGKEVDIQLRNSFADARVWDKHYKARWDITYTEAIQNEERT